MSDFEAMLVVFGEIASGTWYFVVLLAFGMVCATLGALQRVRYM